MLTAADIMTRNVFTLPAAVSAREAGWALIHRGVGGAPVVDELGELVGVLTQSDLALTHLTEDDDRAVTEVMTPALLAVAPDDPALDAVRLMLDHGAHRILVLDDAGGLAGIITSGDVLRLLTEDRVELPSARPATDSSDVWPATWIAALSH